MAKYVKPPTLAVYMTEAEYEALQLLLLRFVPGIEPANKHFKPLVNLTGRVIRESHRSNHMGYDESQEYLGKDWYISPTGRALAHKEWPMWPITPRKYDELTAAVIYHRGCTALGIKNDPPKSLIPSHGENV